MQVRGALKHRNFSRESFSRIKDSLKFVAVENGEFYFRVIKPFSDYQKGQVVRVRTSKKKITIISE